MPSPTKSSVDASVGSNNAADSNQKKKQARAVPGRNPLLARQQETKTSASGVLSSPTDNIMSPCSQKIQANRKHFVGPVDAKIFSNDFAGKKQQQFGKGGAASKLGSTLSVDDGSVFD